MGLVSAAAVALHLILAVGASAVAQEGAPPPPSAAALDKLVAPIALYPDALVAQILPASTHPLQVVEAAESVAHGTRPAQAQAAQWDPSVQALVSFPTVLQPSCGYPVEYGSTGIMTFIVGRDGRIYEQDLGDKTDQVAAEMKDYNPDGDWHLATE